MNLKNLNLTEQGKILMDLDNLHLVKKGKVRDIYDLKENGLLMVASDRISAFDVVMAEAIPDKGKILTQISNMWFREMEDIVPNHLIATMPESFPLKSRKQIENLRHRAVLVKKATPLPIECIVRGYISGSGWKSYQKNGTVCGVELPAGLRESDKLPEPLFTPSTKAPDGEHDENISFEEAEKIVGRKTAEKVRELSLAIYQRGAEIAEKKGIIIADTKFEFGWDENGDLILIDEVLTPDSSRFWPKEEYLPGSSQRSFDKQGLRDYLQSLDWNKQPPPPALPQKIIEETKNNYTQIYKILV